MSRPRLGRVGSVPASHATTAHADAMRLDAYPVPPARREPAPEPTPEPTPTPKAGKGRSIVVVERTPANSVTLSNDEADRIVAALKAKEQEATSDAAVAKLMRSRHVVQQQRQQPKKGQSR